MLNNLSASRPQDLLADLLHRPTYAKGLFGECSNPFESLQLYLSELNKLSHFYQIRITKWTSVVISKWASIENTNPNCAKLFKLAVNQSVCLMMMSNMLSKCTWCRRYIVEFLSSGSSQHWRRFQHVGNQDELLLLK